MVYRLKYGGFCDIIGVDDFTEVALWKIKYLQLK